MGIFAVVAIGNNGKNWGRFRKRNLKHAKECSIQQRRGFACGVCRWKRRFGCSRNSAVSAARFESGFRERDGQGQHWRGPHSHGGFLKMIVCESGGHANGLTYFIFRFLRRPQIVLGVQGLALTRHKKTRSVISCVALLTGKFRRKFRSKSVCALLSANARGKKWTRSGRITQLAQRHLN